VDDVLMSLAMTHLGRSNRRRLGRALDAVSARLGLGETPIMLSPASHDEFGVLVVTDTRLLFVSEDGACRVDMVHAQTEAVRTVPVPFSDGTTDLEVTTGHETLRFEAVGDLVRAQQLATALGVSSPINEPEEPADGPDDHDPVGTQDTPGEPDEFGSQPLLIFPNGRIISRRQTASGAEIVRDQEIDCACTGDGDPAPLADDETELGRWIFLAVGTERPTLMAHWLGTRGIQYGEFATGTFNALLTNRHLHLTLQRGVVTDYGEPPLMETLAMSWPLDEIDHLQGNKHALIIHRERSPQAALAVRDVSSVKPGTWTNRISMRNRLAEFVAALVPAVARSQLNHPDTERSHRATAVLYATTPAAFEGRQPTNLWFCDPTTEQ
jgi:hypothetical protein